MARPPCCRRVEGRPGASVFKPAGIPARMLEEVVMTLDEFEAIRLADLDGLYQEQAAEQMGVSRPTFSRIVEAAHRKVAEALVHGKALKIEGGPVFVERQDASRCPRCRAEWDGVSECPCCHDRSANAGKAVGPLLGGQCHKRRRRRMGCNNKQSGCDSHPRKER